MAKGDVLFEGRMMGMETAYRIVLEAEGEHSPAAQALRKEIRLRTTMKINLGATERELQRASFTIKEFTIHSVLATSMITLWEEYNFGSVRLERFLKEFEINVRALIEGSITWLDILDCLESETGIKLEMPQELLDQGANNYA